MQLGAEVFVNPDKTEDLAKKESEKENHFYVTCSELNMKGYDELVQNIFSEQVDFFFLACTAGVTLKQIAKKIKEKEINCKIVCVNPIELDSSVDS